MNLSSVQNRCKTIRSRGYTLWVTSRVFLGDRSHGFLSFICRPSLFPIYFFADTFLTISDHLKDLSPKECFELFNSDSLSQPSDILQGSHKYLVESLRGKLVEPTVDNLIPLTILGSICSLFQKVLFSGTKPMTLQSYSRSEILLNSSIGTGSST